MTTSLKTRKPDSATETPPGRTNTFWGQIDRTDEALLDFDPGALDHTDIEHARRLLGQHHDVFGNQLAIAKFIDGWLERLAMGADTCAFNDGFAAALIEMRNHLRDGDLLERANVCD